MRLALVLAVLLSAGTASAASADRAALDARAPPTTRAGTTPRSAPRATRSTTAWRPTRPASSSAARCSSATGTARDGKDLVGGARGAARCRRVEARRGRPRASCSSGSASGCSSRTGSDPPPSSSTSAAARPLTGGDAARDRVLDWWASALDREAQATPAAPRSDLRARLRADAGRAGAGPGLGAPPNYWLVASARAIGDLDRAWQAAMAAWVRSALAGDRGAALRADLDRLVLTAIIPERAREIRADRRDRAAGHRHDGDRLGAVQGRLGGRGASVRASVAARISASAAERPGARALAVHDPGPHRVQHGFGEQQQRRVERRHVAHPLRQQQVGAARSGRRRATRAPPSRPAWRAPASARGRQSITAHRLPATTVFSDASGSRLPTHRRPISVKAQVTPLSDGERRCPRTGSARWRAAAGRRRRRTSGRPRSRP